MIEIYLSDPDDCVIHESGFAPISDDVELSLLPLEEQSTGLFWQLGHGPSEKRLEQLGCRLPTVQEYEAMERIAYHIEPYPLPTEEMQAAERSRLEAEGKVFDVQRFREQKMMGLEWHTIHDLKLKELLSDWCGTKHVDNPGKGWAEHGWIVGWWTKSARKFGVKNDVMIQTPSTKHAQSPTYGDYATKARAARARKKIVYSIPDDEPPDTDPAPQTTEGIDVSAHQGTVDWQAVGTQVRFAFIKATEGVGYIDPRAYEHASGALAAGMDVGAYHYLRVRHGAQDAAEQARQFLMVHRKLGCTLLPALDVETQSNEGRTFGEYLDAVRQFVAVVKSELGRAPLLYTYPGFWSGSAQLMCATDLLDCPLWIAHYTHGQPTVPKPWTSALLWQYAAGAGVIGRVNGVHGTVDRNRLFGVIDTIRI